MNKYENDDNEPSILRHSCTGYSQCRANAIALLLQAHSHK
jgi:hypothetical protein